ncbi:hypothetical protein KZ483_25155 [Paenibacillus sp. sptzw28]|uniref:hypothetical protein n=1 Tax=Paenibacillus sp. sptzw28 TaxID=715179 RepID=UPI001C6E2848|nr:hypothetical protein [Paenibacillus sp. sptzw28]QYR20989.1 hypothetical protein KZ483_25155 [Paenibacillus sp. sptzw28]
MNILCSPNTEDIESYLQKRLVIRQKATQLHIVPTLILYRRRLKFYISKYKNQFQNKLRDEGFKTEQEIREKHVALFEMDQWIKELVYANASTTLSKSESIVILERIMKQNEETNHLSWLSVSNELSNTFTELSLTGLNISTLRTFDDAKKWQQSLNIYESYLNELHEKQLLDYGLAANQRLNEFDALEFDELILDGAFLPLNAKHQRLIDIFVSQKKEVTILLPYDLQTPDQPATEAIVNVYENILPKSKWESVQQSKSNSFFIDRLPKNIFRDVLYTNLDNSFALMRFPTLEEELSYILRQIYVLVKYKEVSPKQVVIITPNAMELRPLIREISEQNDLKVRLPRRPFMHLAQGKAIKYLYDIQTDIRKLSETYLNISMFKIFLGGSLLKCETALSEQFEKLESFFADCTSIEEWTAGFQSLLNTKEQMDAEKYPHHPVNTVSKEQLEEIDAIVKQIESASKYLSSISPRTVKDHVEALISFIRSDARFVALEESIWNRLSKITESLGTQERIEINAFEFGERISALFAEQEEFEDGDKANVENDEDDIYLNREILVTGPNNVEFQRYDYVFVCRFTQDMYPEPKIFDWLITKEIEQKILKQTTYFKPDTTKQLERFYLNRSLYHIYLMFCAAKTQITVSYSQIDNGITLTPAHYLHDVAKVFGLEEGNKLENKKAPNLEDLLIQSRVLKCPSSIKPLKEDDVFNRAEIRKELFDRHFTVEELTVYKYCPRRFYYQKKYQSENVYTQLFHIQSYASSCLYEKSVELLATSEPDAIPESIDVKRQYNRLLNKVKSYRADAEEYVRPLFPLSNRIWHNITSQTDFFLSTLIHWVFDNPYVREYRKAGNNHITIQFFLTDKQKQIRLDGFTFTATKELEVQYNHSEIHRYSISNRKDILAFSSNDHDEKEQMKEIKEWYDRFKRSFYNDSATATSTLTEVISNIQSGKFDKNAGGHCKYCTFNKFCHEREVDQ